MIGDDRLGFSRGCSTDPWHAIPTSLAHVYERVKLSPIIVTFSDRLLYTTDNESYVPTNQLRVYSRTFIVRPSYVPRITSSLSN